MKESIKTKNSCLKLGFLITLLSSMSATSAGAHSSQYSSPDNISDLRQTATAQRTMRVIGKPQGFGEYQPEMICPTAKSPVMQEWSNQLFTPTIPINAATKFSSQAKTHPKHIASAKTIHNEIFAPQTKLQPIPVAVTKYKSLPIASAYPFYTSHSSSYSASAKSLAAETGRIMNY